MIATPATPRRAKRLTPALAAVAVVLACVGSPASAQAAVGDGFSIAEATDPDTGSFAPALAPADRAFWAGVCDLHGGSAAIGARPAGAFANCIDHPENVYPPLPAGQAPQPPDPDGWLSWSLAGGSSVGAAGPGWRLADVTPAGAHADGSTSFWFSRSALRAASTTAELIAPDGAPRNITVKLPPGVIGNPNAVPQCQPEDLDSVPTTCPPKTQVGVSTVSESGVTYVAPVYNAAPRDGITAEFVISGLGGDLGLSTNAPVVARARTEQDFGVDATAQQIPSAVPVAAQSFTVWSVPWASSHDRYRPIAGYCGSGSGKYGMRLTGLAGGVANGCSQAGRHYDPSWGPIRPFFTTQTECSPVQPTTSIVADNWHTTAVATADSSAPLLTDCGALPFDATFDSAATSTRADGPSGLTVYLRTPQNNDPPAPLRFDPDDDSGAPAYWKSAAGRATSHLDKTVVTLPAGVSVNPSAAAGLAGCSDEQIGLTQPGNPPRFDNEDPFDGKGAECPDGSVIGTASVNTPLLDGPLTGELVLGAARPGDVGTSGQPLTARLFVVVRNRERGLIAKIAGTTVTDPAPDGRLVATFDENPQVPFEDLHVDVKGGERGMLALQQRCSSRAWSAELTPWSAAHGAGGQPVGANGDFTTDQNCAFGFSPQLFAGMSSSRARGGGTFSFRFSRNDGEHWFEGLTAKLPLGLLASVRDVPLCTNARAAANDCPAASRIGTVDAGAGSGTPFFLEKKGTAYLTEGYKGAPYGLAVSVPVEAGPFKGQSALESVVVRQAIHVDRSTAQVTAVSDPFPLIWHGIPLRVREATVKIDRDRFMLNPSDCSPKSVGSTLVSAEGATADRGVPFQPSGCAALPFEPKLALTLTGKKQVRTGKHPGIKAKVTQAGSSEAGIAKAVVRLPKSLALDPENAQALCEFADGTKPDLENHCPAGSIVGRARAKTPLLKDDLAGNVYFVKNVRRDPVTGNEIRTLPMIVVALRGEIAINLRGMSSTTKGGKLVNTFANVPDAPISQFNLNINGGSNGILAVTRTRRARINLCAKPRSHVAEVDNDGQNGKQHDFDVRMKPPCPKNRKAAGRRSAQGSR